AVLRLHPGEGLSGHTRPFALRRRRDSRPHVGRRHRVRDGGSASPRRNGSMTEGASPQFSFWRNLSRSGRVALVVVLCLWIVAAVSPLATSASREIRLEDRWLPPSAAHLFGTDDLGRDLFARVVAATPLSLAIGLTAAAVSLSVGFLVGSLAGYFGGTLDLLLSRLIEVVLCFPVLFLLLALAAFLPPSPTTVILAIGLTTWPGDARLARAEILKARNLDYTRAAIVAGVSTPRILLRHLLPNALAPLLV